MRGATSPERPDPSPQPSPERESAPGASEASEAGYNFAYLDEGTKRMIRRAILKAIAV
ncbi:alpha-D-ribose 1-methylphosphonate 5-phosphate C-P-lyase PhnJ, partial [Rahnella aceris]|uniref:alpha-D-ribose 1-methylphosphonate 5-phosphate C-P-lyase PhnJ n=1 Tax=Rahnella sp. (strain Y9602) TaxID=2703885 RepID=UPI003FD49EA0